MKKKGRILIICGVILLILLCVGGVLFFTMNRGNLKFSVGDRGGNPGGSKGCAGHAH